MTGAASASPAAAAGSVRWRALRARVRALALLGLAVPKIMLFALVTASFPVTYLFGVVYLHPALVGQARRFTNHCRRLARDWCGVPVPEPYQPPPAAPEPEPNGMYRHCNRLYPTPRWPAHRRRVRWLLADPASWRDLRWLLLDPVAGTALAALAVLAGAPLLRVHGRWTRLLLGPVGHEPVPVRRWWLVRHCAALVRCAVLGGVSLLALPLVTAQVLIMLPYGLWFLWPDVTELSRKQVNMYRRRAGEWCGVDIPEPYHPRPPDPVRQPDGTYREGRTVSERPFLPTRIRRFRWLRRDPATWRDLAWQLVSSTLGAALLVVPPLVALLALTGLVEPWLWRLPVQAFGVRSPVWGWDLLVSALPVPPGLGAHTALSIPVGIGIALACAVLAPALLWLHTRASRPLLAPTARARLAERVQELTETRTEAVDARAAELRRIERDLHDGAQARLIATGLALGTIERLMDTDPAAARKLLAQARESQHRALAELRDLVRGIHPPVLAERGLADAVRALALDSPLDVLVDVALSGRPEPPVESAAYFATCEVLINAAKHAGARRVAVDLRHGHGRLRITVTDDGHGGADPAGGSGLRGIERRLGTFDGILTVDSPAGGPTTVTMEIPCALSPPRTSTS